MTQPSANNQGCLGFRSMSRRQALQAGVFGALGLSMGDLFKLQAQQTTSVDQGKKLTAKAQSVIQIHLGGGMQQQESFDPKPEAPVDIRGGFGITRTRTSEVFSENFPETAKISDKVTVLRSVVGRIPDHGLATYHLFTGYIPSTVIDYPQMGSIVSHELGRRGDLPPYVAIPNKNAFSGGTGFLSSTHAPFELNADPGANNYRVRDFSIPTGVSMERFDRRRTARQIVENRIREMESDPDLLSTMDGFHQQAYSLLTSPQAQRAFTLEGETDETKRLYGSHVTGLRGPDNRFHPKGLAERLIVARRLVEAGVRFVTLTYGAWDCHVDVRANCLDQMPALDHGIAGLIADLDRRRLLDSTIVWLTTEFGRTPKVNATAGRDHYSRCYSLLIAGGGFKKGLNYGASDSVGAEPGRDPLPLENLMHTIYHQLGIDADRRLLAFGTRPIDIIRGRFVEGLVD